MRLLSFLALVAACLSSCQPRHVRQKTRVLKSENYEDTQETGQFKYSLRWVLDARGISVRLQHRPLCERREGSRNTVQRITIREADASNYWIAALAAGIGLAGIAPLVIPVADQHLKSPREIEEDRIFYNGLGVAIIVAGVGVGATIAIATAIGARNTYHPPHKQLAIGHREVIDCGSIFPTSGEMITVQLGENKLQASTDKKGFVRFKLPAGVLGAVPVESARLVSITYRNKSKTIDVSKHQVYTKAVTLLAQRKREAREKKKRAAARARVEKRKRLVKSWRVEHRARPLRKRLVMYAKAVISLCRAPVAPCRAMTLQLSPNSSYTVIAKTKTHLGIAKSDDIAAPFQLEQVAGWIAKDQMMTAAQRKSWRRAEERRRREDPRRYFFSGRKSKTMVLARTRSGKVAMRVRTDLLSRSVTKGVLREVAMLPSGYRVPGSHKYHYSLTPKGIFITLKENHGPGGRSQFLYSPPMPVILAPVRKGRSWKYKSASSIYHYKITATGIRIPTAQGGQLKDCIKVQRSEIVKGKVGAIRVSAYCSGWGSVYIDMIYTIKGVKRSRLRGMIESFW